MPIIIKTKAIMKLKNLNKEIEKINKYADYVKFAGESKDWYVLEVTALYISGKDINRDSLVGIECGKLTISYNKERWTYDYE